MHLPVSVDVSVGFCVSCVAAKVGPAFNRTAMPLRISPPEHDYNGSEF